MYVYIYTNGKDECHLFFDFSFPNKKKFFFFFFCVYEVTRGFVLFIQDLFFLLLYTYVYIELRKISLVLPFVFFSEIISLRLFCLFFSFFVLIDLFLYIMMIV
jgi:hypothetical protein